MPSKKKKYNARFPPARIKKIMQTDEEVGKVAAAVPVIISRALELFLESLLTKACQVTQSRNAKTMTTSHFKQCIESEQQYDFLKDLVAGLPDMQGDREEAGNEGDKSIKRVKRLGVWRRNANGGGAGKVKDKQSESDTDQEEDYEETMSEDEVDEATHSGVSRPTDLPASPPNSSPVPPQPPLHCRFFPLPSTGLPMPAVPMSKTPTDDDDEDYDS
uniref:dr1-associated corepressor n=1 Tax=Myxine glutinosa TaxID=7769 RepID=UPI00358FD011